jgi:Na+/melibiose symporter-like transporter
MLLSAVGYLEGSKIQSPEAVEGLKQIMTFVPVVGLGLSAFVMWGYRLDRDMHDRLVNETQT